MIVALACVTVAILLGWPVHFVGADSLRLAPGRPVEQALDATQDIPPGCVEHTPLDGGVDFPGDYHCAGLAMDYHVDGVALSPAPLWAGQWLFVDEGGSFRRGSCTFNRGIHPSILAASVPVVQTFPRDLDGTKGAYLTWRYGMTSDNVTAAGLWAVFHYYAQDAAGTNRAGDPTLPLVPSLDEVAAASGRADVEAMAIALDAEATRYSEGMTIDVQLTPDARGEADVMAGAEPVADVMVTLAVHGATFEDGGSSRSVMTDSLGAAPFRIVPASSSDVTVTATVEVPAPAQVYRGTSADPSGGRGQTLITSGGSSPLTARTAVAVAETTTTALATPTSTTTSSPPTAVSVSVPASEPEQSFTPEPVPEPATTTAPPSPPTTAGAPDLTPTTDTSPSLFVSAPETDTVDYPLPRTGRTAIGISYWATAMVVAGVGIVGALRRRRVGP